MSNFIINKLYLQDCDKRTIELNSVDISNIDKLYLKDCVLSFAKQAFNNPDLLFIPQKLLIDTNATYYLYIVVSKETFPDSIDFEITILASTKNEDFANKNCPENNYLNLGILPMPGDDFIPIAFGVPLYLGAVEDLLKLFNDCDH